MRAEWGQMAQKGSTFQLWPFLDSGEVAALPLVFLSPDLCVRHLLCREQPAFFTPHFIWPSRPRQESPLTTCPTFWKQLLLLPNAYSTCNLLDMIPPAWLTPI
jgi:hypothetical protein